MNNDNRLTFRRRFGKRLRTLRLRKGISKADVAAVLGCTVQNVDGIERGDWSTDASNLSALADALGVPVAVLLEGEPEHATS